MYINYINIIIKKNIYIINMVNKYVKSEKSFQELLSKEDIDILLENYELVNSKYEIKVGLLVRYYSLINKDNETQELFRMGGTVIKTDFEKDYVVLTNGKVNWSVQINNATFYKKLTIEELKKNYENDIENMDIKLNKYKNYIDKIKKKLNSLIEENKLLLNKNNL